MVCIHNRNVMKSWRGLCSVLLFHWLKKTANVIIITSITSRNMFKVKALFLSSEGFIWERSSSFSPQQSLLSGSMIVCPKKPYYLSEKMTVRAHRIMCACARIFWWLFMNKKLENPVTFPGIAAIIVIIVINISWVLHCSINIHTTPFAV